MHRRSWDTGPALHTSERAGSPFEDGALQAKGPGWLTNIFVERVLGPAGHMARAVWLGELTRQELSGRVAKKDVQLSLFDVATYLGRLDQGLSHLIAAAELDAGSLPAAGQTLAAYDSMAGVIVGWSIDAATGKLPTTLDGPTYHASHKGIRELLRSVAEGHNYLVEALHKNGIAALSAWPVPLLDFDAAPAGLGQAMAARIPSYEAWRGREGASYLLQSRDIAAVGEMRVPKEMLRHTG